VLPLTDQAAQPKLYFTKGMPAVADITYDYPVIEQCVDMMKKKAEEIIGQTDALENDVKRILVDWHGSTADAYSQLCSDLKNDLQQNASNLNNLKTALHTAADNMKQQDQRGAGRVSG
jgi:WXG100 family type VII secretion target